MEDRGTTIKTDIWQFVHSYINLSREGRVDKILCPNDSREITPRIKSANNIDTYFWCHECNTWIKPGLEMIDQMEANMKRDNKK